MGCTPLVSLIVLNYRTPEMTARAVKAAVDAASGILTETIVVDNGSGADAVKKLRILCPDCRFIVSPRNLGFASGMNLGLRNAQGEYAILLNSDVEALSRSVRHLVEHMNAHPGVGLAAPVLLKENGNISRTLLIEPTIWRLFIPGLAKIQYKRWHGRINNSALDVEATEGASVIVRRQAFDRVGLLDEDFFFYNEIVDWCIRFRKHGYGVQIVPQSRMIHKCRGSSLAIESSTRVEMRRSGYQLLCKHFGPHIARLRAAGDIAEDVLRVAFYELVYVLSFRKWKRGRQKLLTYLSLLRWSVNGKPVRSSRQYISSFSSWE